MFKKILSSIENQKIGVKDWLIGFSGIVIIRSLLEAISNPSFSGIIASDASTIIHYALFYITAVLGLASIIYYFTKYAHILKLLLYGLVVTWIPPIVDTIASGANGFKMTYIFNNEHNIWQYFFTFFGTNLTYGATLGIRIEMIIIFASIGYFVWYITKKIKLGVLSAFLSYFFMFFLGALPYFIYSIVNLLSNTPLSYSVSSTTYLQITNSLIPTNMLHGTLTVLSQSRLFELGFNVFMSQLLFILSLVILGFWFWITEKNIFKIIIKNSRWERIGMYLSLFVLGLFYGYISSSNIELSWIDYMSIVCLVISWYASCMFAIHINDLEDVKIDKISNPDRPLSKKDVSESSMRNIGFIWLVISFVGSFIVGYYPFFMTLIFTSAYYIYSASPLRLKRVPILSSFLIGVACLSAVLSGFFFISTNKIFYAFPPLVAIGIIIMFTLGSNIRDIKDIEGDKADGIKTLPIIFGENGKKVVGGLFAFGFLLAPIFFSFYTLYILAIPSAIIGYKIVNRNPYKEKHIFYLYFSFILSYSLLIGILYWFASTLK